MPSFPPASCNTIRMVESLPVVICVARSMASACNAENVFARKVSTVHESALVSTVRRRNSRRVWRVISFFILCYLVLGCAHHKPDGILDIAFLERGLAIKILAQSLLL